MTKLRGDLTRMGHFLGRRFGYNHASGEHLYRIFRDSERNLVSLPMLYRAYQNEYDGEIDEEDFRDFRERMFGIDDVPLEIVQGFVIGVKEVWRLLCRIPRKTPEVGGTPDFPF